MATVTTSTQIDTINILNPETIPIDTDLYLLQRGLVSYKITHADLINELRNSVLESVYPIGSVYCSTTNNTNPATVLGFGTWTAIEGRTIVGYDGADSDFNTAGGEGGDKDTLLGTNNVPHISTFTTLGGYYSNGTATIPYNNTNTTTLKTENNNGSGSDTGIYFFSVPAADAVSTVQPYKVAYMWERTS
jgi:hypothetical protein